MKQSEIKRGKWYMFKNDSVGEVMEPRPRLPGGWRVRLSTGGEAFVESRDFVREASDEDVVANDPVHLPQTKPLAKVPPVVDPQKPDLRLLAKLGSIVVHVEEMLSDATHEFDVAAVRALVQDADVQAWLKAMGPLVPRKR